MKYIKNIVRKKEAIILIILLFYVEPLFVHPAANVGINKKSNLSKVGFL